MVRYVTVWSGWFQLFQAAIRNYAADISPEQRAERSFESFREFLPAVGRFFVPIMVASLLYIALFFGVIKLIGFIGVKYIGFTENINPAKLAGLFGDNTKVYEFVASLTELDRKTLIKWDLLAIFMMGGFSYLTMFWFQAIMMNGENAFLAFVSGLRAVLSKPFVTFGFFLLY